MTNVSLHSFVLICFLLLFCQVNAQKTEVSSSVKLNNKVSNFRILGKTGDKYIVERYGTNLHILDYYNPYLKSQGSRQIQLNKDEFIETFWLQPASSWMLKVQQDKNTSYLQAHKMDAKLNISSKPILLDSLNERKDLLENNLRTKLSLNESKLLIYSPIFSQGKIDHFYSRLYDGNMNLINQKNIKEVNLLEKDFIDLIVLNNGSYIFISKETEGSVYYFTMVDTDGSLKTHSYIPVKTVYKKLAFEVDNLNNSLFISGFFGNKAENKKDKNGAREFFVSTLSLDDFSTIYTEIVPFTNEFYVELTGKESQIDPPELFTFYIKNILPRIDGGAIICTESYFKTEEKDMSDAYFSISGVSNYNYSTIYNFNDIVIYHIDSSGNFVEQEIIKKKQVSHNDGGAYSSFYIANLRDELKLLFLDDISSDAKFTKATVTEESRTRSYTLFNIGGKDVFPVMQMGKQTAPNEVLIPSYKRNKLQLIKVVF